MSVRTKKYSKKKIKSSKIKISKKLTFDQLQIPSYEEVRAKISRRCGKRPSFHNNFTQGNWTEQALRVLSERYLLKDREGKIIETPDEMGWRVAWDIASAETCWGATKTQIKNSAEEFYQLLVSHEFLPNSPTLMNAGTGNGLQYSACFVLPVGDSLVEIFDAIKYQALIHQTGGGTGFSFSRLRPRGSMVKSSRGTASGPVSFMKIFDAATNGIKQGGKRRGANMGILRVDHPDILEFIHCKEEGGITNFNISIAITDKFMNAFENDSDYELINPKTGEVCGKLNARKVFNEIAQGAWKTGDPGLIFIDRINKGSSNPIPSLGPVESTNPCGEQPLYPYDSCNLGSIFLTYFIKEKEIKESQQDGLMLQGKEVDWEKLRKATHLAVRFLDNVIEMNPYPMEEIRKVSLAVRRIGLGVGGWADMLIQLGIPYDSQEALDLGEMIMSVVQKEAVLESEELALKRGPFPFWSQSIYKKSKPRRNSTVTTIAPTGSISIIAGASSGIEPLFAIAYQHIVKDKHLDRTLNFINPNFEEITKKIGFWSEELRQKVISKGVIHEISEIPQEIKNIFVTAHEIHHDWHIRMQAAFQKYTDNAVSKTINMANGVTPQEIAEAYLLSWKTNCKGITVFRDGCKDSQVLNLGIRDSETESEIETLGPTLIRPFKVVGATYKLNTPVGGAFITINEDEKGQPLEVFINVGKAGSDVNAMAEALGRLISTSLRFKGNLEPVERAKEIAYQLSGIGGRRSVGFGPKKILSLPDALAIALSTHFGFKINGKVNGVVIPKQEEISLTIEKDLKPSQEPGQFSASINGEMEKLSVDEMSLDKISQITPSLFKDDGKYQDMMVSETSEKIFGDICPSCGASSLVYQEGCTKCLSCAYSEC
ncbi:ribonucleoside-diphosphate reductase, adenosylcobalamin-dependent [Candidatus Woesebacteria bacterium RBG_16_34_12]|uniref:Vitamin B12-dependent ribonucleotide reductase n=1 Tax=Candidatus Woesebacteria bacterium RBG_16_34_12 TaxID=1802480 RepID=A0A1F7X9S7_9BACT|nr:MAG: ribonucleoside-diphosphate reductase, adenosylcobalamin-dependent [Candidatus Woesebacteria bacterium RBG_16_34_12]